MVVEEAGAREERVVVVTGAARGLGNAAVRRLSARGVRIVAVDRDEGQLGGAVAAVATAGEVLPVAADVTKPEEVKAFVDGAVERWGRLDGIFNNAGIQGPTGPFVDYDDGELWNVLNINFYGVWLGMKHAIPHFISRGGGVIVNTASSLAYRGWKEVPAYVASKHAVAGLTKTIAIEYAAQNISANCLCPSAMDTPMLEGVARNVGEGDLAAGHAMIAALSPSGRIADPNDVAGVAEWLLLDAPRHLSGVLIPVDAAETAG